MKVLAVRRHSHMQLELLLENSMKIVQNFNNHLLRGMMSSALLIAPAVTTTSIIHTPVKFRMETFWYRLTWDVLENSC